MPETKETVQRFEFEQDADEAARETPAGPWVRFEDYETEHKARVEAERLESRERAEANRLEAKLSHVAAGLEKRADAQLKDFFDEMLLARQEAFREAAALLRDEARDLAPGVDRRKESAGDLRDAGGRLDEASIPSYGGGIGVERPSSDARGVPENRRRASVVAEPGVAQGDPGPETSPPLAPNPLNHRGAMSFLGAFTPDPDCDECGGEMGCEKCESDPLAELLGFVTEMKRSRRRGTASWRACNRIIGRIRQLQEGQG